MSKLFSGIIPPMLTPFDEEEEVDEEVLRGFVNFLIEKDVHGLFPCGSIGEFSNLITGDMKKIYQIVVDETDGRVPVIPGTGGSCTKEAVIRTKKAEKAGVNGVIVVTPFYLEVDQEGMKKHFGRVAESTDLPILIYHIPQLTGQELTAETVISLADEYENIVGIKDSSAELRRGIRVINRSGKDFIYLQGQDTLLLPTLLMGGDGGVTGTSNVEPSFAVETYESFKRGDINKAKEMQNKLFDLTDACRVGPFPENFKQAAKALGNDLGHARSPIRSQSEKEKKEQLKLLEQLDLI